MSQNQSQQDVKISFERPPVYNRVVERFKSDLSHAIFTYGDTIYNPGRHILSADVIAHEKTHIQQQAGPSKPISGKIGQLIRYTPEEWWDRYLTDNQFLIDQEAQAYGRQSDFVIRDQGIKGREQRFRVRMHFAKVLAGQLYGNIISLTEAERKIRTYSTLI